ncbi:MAG: DUF3631 domain-containing protein [Actinomycetota bacterium]|nr:DUF3631 domain-containing protein [Actinomycetota bacterium]
MSDPDTIVAGRLHESPKSTPNLAELLEWFEGFVRRFVALTDAQAVTIALWIVHTYCMDAAELTAYLNIFSAVKRSGKTLLLDVLRVLVRHPMLAADMTPAVLFRVVDEFHPTILFDEVDVIFAGKSERADELRGLLNAGFRRGGAAWRMEMGGKAAKARSFDVFGAKALAGIGKLPDTIADRSAPIELARKVRGIDVERFRSRGKLEETAPLREQVAQWAEEHLEALRAARPNLPDELNDRQQDVWEPLLAIADEAGGDWPTRARAAARELHGGGDEADTSATLLLLRHLRDLFAERGDAAALPTETILGGLVDNDEGPWARWWSVDSDHAKRSAASGLAKMLKNFGITSTTIRVGDATPRGYRREAFFDAWNRYLPGGNATPATDATPQVAPTSAVASVADVAPVPETDRDEPDWPSEETGSACDCGHAEFMHFGEAICRRPSCECVTFREATVDA